jgi:hypothetical protein
MTTIDQLDDEIRKLRKDLEEACYLLELLEEALPELSDGHHERAFIKRMNEEWGI